MSQLNLNDANEVLPFVLNELLTIAYVAKEKVINAIIHPPVTIPAQYLNAQNTFKVFGISPVEANVEHIYITSTEPNMYVGFGEEYCMCNISNTDIIFILSRNKYEPKKQNQNDTESSPSSESTS